MHETPRQETELLRTLYEIKADVKLIKDRQEEDHDRLFGNGRPGELDQLESRINAIELKHAEEKGGKESDRRWTAAIGSLCGIVAGAVGGWLAKHFG